MSYRRNGDTTRVMPPMPPQQPPGEPPGSRPPRGPRRTESWSPGVFSPAIFLVGLLVIAILVAAGIASQRGRLAAPTATAARAQGTAAPATAARTFVVANTGGEGVYLRRTPNLADRDAAYVEGTQLVAIGADEQGDGQSWHHVRAPDGKTGYVPAQYTKETTR